MEARAAARHKETQLAAAERHEESRSWARQARLLAIPGAMVAVTVLIGYFTGAVQFIYQRVSPTPDRLPFVLSINPYPGSRCASYLFRSGDEPTQPLTPLAPEQLNTVLKSHHAVQANNYGTAGYLSKIIFSITGTDRSPVTLTSVSFNIVDRGPGLTGSSYSGQCGGGTEGRFIQADLSSDPPKIVKTNADPAVTWGSDAGVALTPITFPYTVSDDDSETFYVLSSLQSGYVAFTINIGWMYKDRQGSTRVDNHGQPFEVTKPDRITGEVQ